MHYTPPLFPVNKQHSSCTFNQSGNIEDLDQMALPVAIQCFHTNKSRFNGQGLNPKVEVILLPENFWYDVNLAPSKLICSPLLCLFVFLFFYFYHNFP